MLRTSYLAAAFVGAAALSALAAAEPDLSGSWLISYISPSGTREVNVCIVKIDGATASVIAYPIKAKIPPIKSFTISGNRVAITLPTGMIFEGTIGDDSKQILGGYGSGSGQLRAKMTRTEKDVIAQAFAQGNSPAEMTKAEQLILRTNVLRIQARQQKDTEKKKELLGQMDEAQKEADAKLPDLYRAAIEAKPEDPASLDAAVALIHSAGKWKVPADEVRKLIAIVEKQAAPYGPKYAGATTLEVAESLAAQKGFERVAVEVLSPLSKKLADGDPAEFQVKVLTAFKAALEGAGKTSEAKAVDARLAKLDARLDEEYLAAVPPFKPTAFDGRKDKAANRVAVMELFTGAQCPPCIAADVAFDALAKSYRPTDLVLIQYHMHIPGPDPLTNPDSIARWDYYSAKFPMDIRGTPATAFNGKPQAGGGGGMDNAEGKFAEYRKIVDPLLEKTTAVKLSGKATRRDDELQIAVEVDGAATDGDLKLRLLVVEEVVKYVGGNRLRFHHHVVRAMPGGAAGVAVKDGILHHTATANVAAVRKDLQKYLGDYAANERPFPNSNRPLDMKNLKVLALVQDDKNGEIVQALEMDIEQKRAGGGE